MNVLLGVLGLEGLVRGALTVGAALALALFLALSFVVASLAPPAARPPAAAPETLADAPLAAAQPGGAGASGGYAWAIRFGFAQPYGAAQFSPSLPIHRGVDIQVQGAPDGGRGRVYTPFQPGVVAAVTQDPFGGNGVIVRTPSGLFNRYFHNAAVLVRAGQPVDTSTPLAILGDTGSPGFPHVHFEVSRGINGDPLGALIDPRPFMAGTER